MIAFLSLGGGRAYRLEGFERIAGHGAYSPRQRGVSCSKRLAWIGGHGTEPYEQNTQQSPGFGRSVAPQPVQV